MSLFTPCYVSKEIDEYLSPFFYARWFLLFLQPRLLPPGCKELLSSQNQARELFTIHMRINMDKSPLRSCSLPFCLFTLGLWLNFNTYKSLLGFIESQWRYTHGRLTCSGLKSILLCSWVWNRSLIHKIIFKNIVYIKEHLRPKTVEADERRSLVSTDAIL